MEILPRTFYDRDTLDVAQDLLGKVVVRRTDAGIMTGRIVETEGYRTGDPGCHTFRGKTERNAVMFGPPGHTYVFFNYGMYYLLNFVTGPESVGEAVLIRALEPLDGVDLMRKTAGARSDYPSAKLLSGPGKLSKAMNIDRDNGNGLDVTDPASPITVWMDGGAVMAEDIVITTRVGLSAGAEMPWRYYVRGSAAVSRP